MSPIQKNITLLVILGLLILSSISLSLTDETDINTNKNKDIFSVQDTSQIDLISIKSLKEQITLNKVDGTWQVNKKYKAEQNIVRVLLSIACDVEVVRNVPDTQAKEIADRIPDNGYLIDFINNGESVTTFYSFGNDTKTISYMMSVDKKNPMIVNIPGYESYVAGIFEIPANDWRDRVLLKTTWRSLQKLNISYLEYPELNVNIKFDFNFLKIDGITNLDTARMMAFIDEFNFLQTDRYLDKGQIEAYDSLLLTPKTVTMTIEDINAKNSKTIDFFPIINNNPMMLGYVNEDDQMVLFEANRIQKLFAVKADFEANPIDRVPE